LRKTITEGNNAPWRVIVFVHGIYSNGASAFQQMLTQFGVDPDMEGWFFATYDYNFHADMRDNGVDLAQTLGKLVDDCHVYLVCHSMGGLIGRLAVLSGQTQSIRRLFMLGTPNFGAIRFAQLSLLSQLAFGAAGKVWGLFRKPGVKDLTRVPAIMAKAIESGERNAKFVDYVTIPGTYFNESRSYLSRVGRDERRRVKEGFRLLEIGTLVTGVLPLWRINLKRPHDGIVEEESNNMSPGEGGRKTEKQGAFVHPDKVGPTYLHVNVDECDVLIHTQIQHDGKIIAIVKSLLLAPNLPEWYDSLPEDFITTMRERAPWA
jgi:pimeloyl-ACP methyl ester carboxylesterase